MDLEKLIEQRDKLIADVTATLESRGGRDRATPRPAEIHEVQARRIEERIESLASRKEDLVNRIDAETEALKGELAARLDRLDSENRAQEALTREAAATPAPKDAKGLNAAAREAGAAPAPEEEKKKKARPSKAPKAG